MNDELGDLANEIEFDNDFAYDNFDQVDFAEDDQLAMFSPVNAMSMGDNAMAGQTAEMEAEDDQILLMETQQSSGIFGEMPIADSIVAQFTDQQTTLQPAIASEQNSPTPTPDPPRDLKAMSQASEELVLNAWKNRELPISLVTQARKVLKAHSLKMDDPDQEFDPELEEVLMSTLLASASMGAESNGGAKSKAVSTRLLNYIRFCIAERLISQRVAVKVLVRSPILQERSEYSAQTKRDLAALIAEILPWYDVMGKSPEAIRDECIDFLEAIKILLRRIKETLVISESERKVDSFIRETLQALSYPRVIALSRCAGRRVPASWSEAMSAISEFENLPTAGSNLKSALAKFQIGLSSRFENPDYSRLLGIRSRSPGRFLVDSNVFPWPNLIRVSKPVLGGPVAGGLDSLWSNGEAKIADFQTLQNLEQSAELTRLPTTLLEKVRMCEMLVYTLAATANTPEGQARKQKWGGILRLRRMIRDSMPQAKAYVRAEYPSLIVACGVVGCCAIVLGGSRSELPQREKEQAVECILGLQGFAVENLEAVLRAEDAQDGRPFGAWLLLLASRCGNMLQIANEGNRYPRLNGSEHVRAAKALRDWSLFGGAAVTSFGLGVATNFTSESASSLVMESAMRVIDASDTTGSDETLIELCSDLVV
ncbi:hypothetical protein NDN08_000879 [Rhodosorus marinus]|uniref:Uncharacterized protein n=1 Tax=Rhodosorus marinus TaxID=101924 RepID=A0AAV8UTG8_9RHOD|nr:hypothetical protein NDN08_000879 [Rhodosorus marinus]